MNLGQTIEIPSDLYGKTVWILDDEEIFLRAATKLLNKAGFVEVGTFTTYEALSERLSETQPSLLLVDIHLGFRKANGIAITSKIRKSGYDGILVVITGDSSSKLLFQAAMAGADDFLIKGPSLDFPGEIIRFLTEDEGGKGESSYYDELKDLGFIRSTNLNEREIQLLTELCTDFPPIKELARRLNKQEQSLRKDISRIYRKLGLDHYGQLAHLVTTLFFYLHRK